MSPGDAVMVISDDLTALVSSSKCCVHLLPLLCRLIEFVLSTLRKRVYVKNGKACQHYLQHF